MSGVGRNTLLLVLGVVLGCGDSSRNLEAHQFPGLERIATQRQAIEAEAQKHGVQLDAQTDQYLFDTLRHAFQRSHGWVHQEQDVRIGLFPEAEKQALDADELARGHAYRWRMRGEETWRYGEQGPGPGENLEQVWKRGQDREKDGMVYSEPVFLDVYLPVYWSSYYQGWSYRKEADWRAVLRQRLPQIEAHAQARLAEQHEELRVREQRAAQELSEALESLQQAESGEYSAQVAARKQVLGALIRSRVVSIVEAGLAFKLDETRSFLDQP